MSTRANIIIKDKDTKLYFYRHCDGYPEETGEDLKSFCEGYSKKMRTNAMQSAGHLILHGAGPSRDGYNDRANKLHSWKCGDYEMTDQLHADVDYVYLIDLDAGVLEMREIIGNFFEAPSIDKTRIKITHAFKLGAK